LCARGIVGVAGGDTVLVWCVALVSKTCSIVYVVNFALFWAVSGASRAIDPNTIFRQAIS